eukprot:6574450-Alexandrium_andersonii.AAC.1
MSASLVGSEMCIRDRASRSSERAPPVTASNRGEARARAVGPGGAQASSCLLYTSDAADDM